MAASVAAKADPSLGSATRVDDIGAAALVAASEQRRRRNGMTVRSKVLVALAGAAIVVAACQTGTPSGSGSTGSGSGPDGALVKRSDIKIEIVTHGQAQDGFWGVVRNGVKAAASQMGVTANYSAPGAESDMPGMVSLIDAAVAKKPTGLVVSIPEPGRARSGHQEGRRRGHPGRLDELRALTCSRASASSCMSARPSTRPALARASGSRTQASRTPCASTRKSATRR
jgi:hypothetical protein